MKVLAVIPAHNEAESLPAFLRELAEGCPELELLVVDDGSTDETVDLLPRLGVRWLRLPTRLGVGNAVRAGLRYAREHGYPAAVRLDADGQHPASAVQPMLDALLLHRADAVQGSRYLPGAGSYRTPALRFAAQAVLAWSLSRLTRQPVTDPTSGCWAFGSRALALLSREHPSGYCEPELHLLLFNRGLKLVEVPIEMRQRLAGTTTLSPPRAAIALARAALAMVVVPFRD